MTTPTPTGADAMKEAERLLDVVLSAHDAHKAIDRYINTVEDEPEDRRALAAASEALARERGAFLAHIRKLVEAQPAAVAGEAGQPKLVTYHRDDEGPAAAEAYAALAACLDAENLRKLVNEVAHGAKATLGPGRIALTRKDWTAIKFLPLAAPAATLVGEVEPVWVQPDHLAKARRAPFLCRVEPAKRDDFVPLYASPAATAGVPTDLHAAMMNLSADKATLAKMDGSPKGFYLLGFRDARHAAAELVSVHLPACDSSEASGSAIPARPTLPGDDASDQPEEHPQMPVERIAMLWNSLPLETDAEAVVSFVRAVEAYHRQNSKPAWQYRTTNPKTGEVSAWFPCTAKGAERARAVGYEVRIPALLAGGDQKAAPLHPSLTPELNTVLQFLYGAEQMDGHWFGDRPEGRGRYWWRSILRNAIESAFHPSSVQAVDGDEPVVYGPTADECATGNRLLDFLMRDRFKTSAWPREWSPVRDLLIEAQRLADPRRAATMDKGHAS